MANLAASQYGIVTRRQLAELGYSERMIVHAVRIGRLQTWHPGVYAVGHGGLSPHGLCKAAVVYRGEGALISFQSAVWLWGLERKLEIPVNITLRGAGNPRSAIGIHHAPELRDEDAATTERLPVTAVPRTLLDYASVAATYRLEGAIDRADQLELLDPAAIDRIVEEAEDHPGANRLRRAIQVYRQSGYTRSGGGEMMLEALAEAGVAEPAVNDRVGGYELDFYWEPERFAVELDGWDGERTLRSREEERRRREELATAGVETIRITGTRLKHEPRRVADRVAEHLDRRRGGEGAE
jgi:hypothetical protein